ncbi:hypothetical protein FBUS_06144 [Fasciolopsis buskii]|uniref:C2H2-type domain-containing protein n=1 Tax=Fasciolopsis buskii TaxID=27845 RepID=A0A8E0RW68_9TREM|nr:hypothetical protein FBUS_06144 [Fasciolopsis buski]
MVDTYGQKQCFSCEAKFDSDEAFWNHVYNEDCGSGSSGDNAIASESITQIPPPMCTENRNSQSAKKVAAQESSDKYDCALCGVHFLTSFEWYNHSKSDEHRSKVTAAAGHYASSSLTKKEKSSTQFKVDVTQPSLRPFCDECHVPLPSLEARDLHVMGKKHQKVINRIRKDNLFSAQTALGLSDNSTTSEDSVKDTSRNLPPNPEPGASVSITNSSKTPLFCDYCSLELPDILAVKQHLSEEQHKKNEILVSNLNAEQHSTVPSLFGNIIEPNSKQLGDLVAVLRRLCLVQLTSLMYELEQSGFSDCNDPVSLPRTNVGTNEKIVGISTDDLLQLFREVCREELQLLLSRHVPVRNAKSKSLT